MAMEEKKRGEYLQQVPMFSDLKEKDLTRLAAATVERRLRKGDLIFREGDEAKGFYLLARGRVKVFKVTVDGREQTLHIISPGETFAEVALFAGSAYPASAQALEESSIIFLPRQDLLTMVEKNPQLALSMMAGFARWVRQFNSLLSEYSKSVPSRLAGYLMAEAGRQSPGPPSDGVKIRLEVNKTEIASFLGTISATLSRAFGQLKEGGLIELDDREVVILDVDRLRDTAAGDPPGSS